MTDTMLCGWIVSTIEQTLSANEAREANFVLRWLLEFLSRLGISIRRASCDDLQRFSDHRKLLGRSDSSILRLMSTLTAIDRVLVGAGLISQNRAEQLTRPKVEARSSKFDVNLRLVDAVIKHHQGIAIEAPSSITRTKRLAILHLSADIGMLCSEIAALKMRDLLQLDNGQVLIGRETSHERIGYPSAVGLTSLRAFQAHRLRSATSLEEHVFISKNPPYGPVTCQNIAAIIAKAISNAGFGDSGLTPGDFHRSVGTRIVGDGHGWPTAKEALGYKVIPRDATSKPFIVNDLAVLIAACHPLG